MPGSITHDIEIDDGDAGRVIAVGSLLGVLSLYGVVVLMGIVGGATAGESFALGIWPSLVAGPFVGSVLGLGWLLTRLEHEGEVVAMPTARPVPSRRAA